jgi:hypothetical protein
MKARADVEQLIVKCRANDKNSKKRTRRPVFFEITIVISERRTWFVIMNEEMFIVSNECKEERGM